MSESRLLELLAEFETLIRDEAARAGRTTSDIRIDIADRDFRESPGNSPAELVINQFQRQGVALTDEFVDSVLRTSRSVARNVEAFRQTGINPSTPAALRNVAELAIISEITGNRMPEPTPAPIRTFPDNAQERMNVTSLVPDNRDTANQTNGTSDPRQTSTGLPRGRPTPGS